MFSAQGPLIVAAIHQYFANNFGKPGPSSKGQVSRSAGVQKYDVTLILFTLHYSALHVIALWAFKVAYLYDWKSTVFFTGLISILTYQILNNNNLNSLSHLYFPQCSDIRQYQPGSCKYQPLLKKWHTFPASPDFCAENCSYKSGTRCSLSRSFLHLFCHWPSCICCK